MSNEPGDSIIRGTYCFVSKSNNHVEAGTWTLEIIRPGSPPTPETVRDISIWLWALAGELTPAPLCALCDAEFWLLHTRPPAAFLYLKPAAPQSQPATLSGLCHVCAEKTDAELWTSAAALVGAARILPAANFHADGGRA
jgi:hypothetical protein